ncbi:hypothetical protein QAD02_011454 [Eretmocerus hayati]|uniref:Uncharacterized protein n=1 Tax=Eretmocerus hayati TaxID=131215 RepID=A0ACC2NWS7_9HYME|nr:hypothetical protein QAD02_011454 [Eretmocerus hayati]
MDEEEAGEAVIAAVQITNPMERSLLLAMLRNDIGTVRAIVDAGFRFHQEPQDLPNNIAGMPMPFNGLTPSDPFRQIYLSYIANGHLEMTEMMLKAGADMDCKTMFLGDGPLTLAVQIEDRDVRWKMVKMLMDAGLRPVDENLKNRSTSVHEAVYKNDIELVKLFLAAGAQLNCIDHPGLRSPLHCAVSMVIRDESYFDMIKQLVELGADINITTKDGSTVLHYLIEYQEYNEEKTWKILKFLLDLGANLNVTNNAKVSPLAMAAAEDQLELVEKMIQAGADVNISKQCTGSPMQLAVSRNNLTMVELLLKRGANIDARDEDGNNILYYAAQLQVYRPKHSLNSEEMILGRGGLKATENLAIIKKIVALGVPVDCPEYGKYKPFASALRFGNMAAVNFFVENGIEVENSGVRFPLHQAAYNQNQEVMKYLIEKRLYDVDERNDLGLTPLYIAAGSKRFSCVFDLVTAGADVNLSCKEIDQDDPSQTCQRTPLSKAMITAPLMALSKAHPSSIFGHRGDFRITSFLISAGANISTPDVFLAYKLLITLYKHDLESNRNSDEKYHSDQLFYISPLIAQIALLKDQNRPMKFDYENYFLTSTPHALELFEQCSTQLELLKTSTLFESLTLYDVLIGKDITHLVNNEKVVAILDSPKNYEMFRMYFCRLRDHRMIAEAKQALMNDAIGVLKKLLQSQFDEQPFILHSILSKLQIKDLINLSSMIKQ